MDLSNQAPGFLIAGQQDEQQECLLLTRTDQSHREFLFESGIPLLMKNSPKFAFSKTADDAYHIANPLLLWT